MVVMEEEIISLPEEVIEQDSEAEVDSEAEIEEDSKVDSEEDSEADPEEDSEVDSKEDITIMIIKEDIKADTKDIKVGIKDIKEDIKVDIKEDMITKLRISQAGIIMKMKNTQVDIEVASEADLTVEADASPLVSEVEAEEEVAPSEETNTLK